MKCFLVYTLGLSEKVNDMKNEEEDSIPCTIPGAVITTPRRGRRLSRKSSSKYEFKNDSSDHNIEKRHSSFKIEKDYTNSRKIDKLANQLLFDLEFYEKYCYLIRCIFWLVVCFICLGIIITPIIIVVILSNQENI